MHCDTTPPHHDVGDRLHLYTRISLRSLGIEASGVHGASLSTSASERERNEDSDASFRAGTKEIQLNNQPLTMVVMLHTTLEDVLYGIIDINDFLLSINHP